MAVVYRVRDPVVHQYGGDYSRCDAEASRGFRIRADGNRRKSRRFCLHKAGRILADLLFIYHRILAGGLHAPRCIIDPMDIHEGAACASMTEGDKCA